MKQLIVILSCILVTAQASPRLDGGTLATRIQFPWHVHLQPIGLPVTFSGFVISDSWVLTCAACANKAGAYDLLFGHFNLSEASELGRVVQRVAKADVILHPEYDPSQFNVNNIALIRLPTPINLSAYISPIRLPLVGTNDTYVNYIGRSSGFGTGPEGPALVMRYADLTVVADTSCRGLVDGGQMCAAPIASIGPCKDEGSAFVITESDAKGTAIGIFSYGYAEGPCPGTTALYTRITTFMEWINSVIGSGTETTVEDIETTLAPME